ncbi:MAG: poly(R)-hydroxyalkanoic acid synthase subunit PhaE [Gammaproteobacteria bacterium]
MGDAALNDFLRAAPAAMLHGLAGERGHQPWAQWSATLTRWADELLRLPLIGPGREWQSLVRAIERAALAEGAARDRLIAHMQAVLRAARLDLAERLEQDNGPPITTLRALYDLWIECAEQAYAEHVMGDDYARDFAAWVDAGSDLRLAIGALLTRAAGAVDAPRREEIDALLRRQRVLEEQLAALQAARTVELKSAAAAAAARPAEVAQAQPSARAAKPAPQPRQSRKAERRPASPKAQAKPRAPRPEITKAAAPRPARKPGSEFDIAEILGMGK